MTTPAIAHDARACLARFLRHVPEAAGRLSALSLQLVEEPDRIADRSNMRGHLTASALVLSPDLSEVLMIDHLTLLRLLQPGGHADEGETLQEEARRENVEETGVVDIDPVGPSPIDVDTHAIPANPRKGEGDHFHHDFMFAFVARSRDLPVPQLEEVSRALWVPIRQARLDPRIDRAISRIV
jgi:8-oxo-dGTP pyrophosphatase MutT (NUDIX family)